jgi:hypothetical protein
MTLNRRADDRAREPRTARLTWQRKLAGTEHGRLRTRSAPGDQTTELAERISATLERASAIRSRVAVQGACPDAYTDVLACIRGTA